MKKIVPSYVRVPLIFAIVMGAMEYFIDSGSQPAFIKFPMVGLFLLVFLFLLVAIEIVISAVDNVTYHMLTDERKKQLEVAQSVSFTESKFLKNLSQKLTRTKEMEEEYDIMLEHDYDGIKELDNVLPPWWVYMFYMSIIFAFVYIIRFHVLNDYTQQEEFETEMENARIEIEKYKLTAPDLLDKEKVTLLTDAASLAEGKKLYETSTCAACHKPDGGGSIGPNLTDDHWILGGGIKNVFNTLMEGGREGKGMVAWKATIKPADLQKIASYVISLQGSNPPDAKPAEGDVWVDENTPAPAAPAEAEKPAEEVVVQ
ncbi:cbb3-type cytochrome c oxidase N-terminal domain-containing protein [Flavobacterium sp.]|uniref:cbb3-type cytochrome c oxidase N-terminal domain-containing protein n=1 Tax=Flavobacterium sp. TaxID=239 RepID=UPI00260EE659|nr:cbb3-type cytochrome c oxidase N-terminal domain-containing protein [Flavobacterium sp.]MDD2986868.1 cbb3-type cytochrome c oxidase N-terminal domain-containing protein [Flavobacterium sp.]